MILPSGFGPCFLGRQLVLGRCRLQIFQLQFHLRQESRLALRAVAVKLAAKLLNLKLKMGDQRFRAGVNRLGASRNGLGFHARSALGQDHRMSSGKIGKRCFHAT